MISKPNRQTVLKILLNNDETFSFIQEYDDEIINYLNEIWDLKNLPSEDQRFNNAELDVYQHMVRNNDWELQYLFTERLKLIEIEEKFNLFLEKTLSPKYQKNPDIIHLLMGQINPIIKSDNLALAIISYEDDCPILELTTLDTVDRDMDIPLNKIPFYVLEYPSMPVHNFMSNYKADINKPSQFFILIADNWDDYHNKTTFWLVYYKNGDKIFFESVKIGHKTSNITINELPENFITLTDDFFSLGQSKEYYQKLSLIFGKMLPSVLYSIKDTAFFSEISDKYENLNVFKNSLIRDDIAERMYRVAKPMLSRGDLNELYSFKYNFFPKYSEKPIWIPFEFSKECRIPKRIITLIGKNGAGKTQLLTSLPLDISKKNNTEKFSPSVPIFSKVIAVSYSTFDNFEIPEKTIEFNYIYCGLRDKSGNVISENEQLERFNLTWRKIIELNRINSWKKVITNILDKQIIDLFIKPKPEAPFPSEIYFDKIGFEKARKIMSSGQSIILYVISEIVANIRLDSLLLFDEPETHLHPNAISQLINGISELVTEFDSYCIIATHSPLIVQEMFSRDVLILSKEENIPLVRNIGIESFGENLSVITEEIFGNRSIPKLYESTIENLVKKYKNYDKVIEIMKEDNLPLSLNVRIYLQTLVNKK